MTMEDSASRQYLSLSAVLLGRWLRRDRRISVAYLHPGYQQDMNREPVSPFHWGPEAVAVEHYDSNRVVQMDSKWQRR